MVLEIPPLHTVTLILWIQGNDLYTACCAEGIQSYGTLENCSALEEAEG